MVHNGIEYGDMQLIGEAYVLLKNVAGLNNAELHEVFTKYNTGDLDSFLMEITSNILGKKDQEVYDLTVSPPAIIPQSTGEGYLVNKVLDRTGNKGTGKMTIHEGADRANAVSTMGAALDARFISFDKDTRVELSKVLPGPPMPTGMSKEQLIADVEAAMFCSKICSYAQGMNLIRAASDEFKWQVDLGECARIWTGGCIIRANFLGDIKKAYDKNPRLASLLADPYFLSKITERQAAWRRIVSLACMSGTPCPSMMASLSYYDSYRHADLDSSSLIQAQRDFFGSHTFERKDTERGQFFHCKWTDAHAI
jgi:6-phosphogluconate dehydrogenase